MTDSNRKYEVGERVLVLVEVTRELDDDMYDERPMYAVRPIGPQVLAKGKLRDVPIVDIEPFFAHELRPVDDEEK